ncbi:MAG: ribose 5-phosphate isomerase B [Ruminococcus sp.]|nr:ribose 5-phosphate isomerase B [Candidatus Apopatosoma intestinale]
MKTIVFGADHAGYLLKDQLIETCRSLGYSCLDEGTNSGESVDYPVFAARVCETVRNGKADCGILVCGTGIGMSIAANRHLGIRAAVCSDPVAAKYTRLHNDANVLCLGARMIGSLAAEEIVRAFLETEFMGGKHQKRIEMLETFH